MKVRLSQGRGKCNVSQYEFTTTNATVAAILRTSVNAYDGLIYGTLMYMRRSSRVGSEFCWTGGAKEEDCLRKGKCSNRLFMCYTKLTQEECASGNQFCCSACNVLQSGTYEKRQHGTAVLLWTDPRSIEKKETQSGYCDNSLYQKYPDCVAEQVMPSLFPWRTSGVM